MRANPARGFSFALSHPDAIKARTASPSSRRVRQVFATEAG